MPRILVVDDQSDVRAMFSMLLRVNHFEVEEAENAAAALRAFETTTFDGAIVDIFLGDACGLDLKRPGLPGRFRIGPIGRPRGC